MDQLEYSNRVRVSVHSEQMMQSSSVYLSEKSAQYKQIGVAFNDGRASASEFYTPGQICTTLVLASKMRINKRLQNEAFPVVQASIQRILQQGDFFSWIRIA